MITTGCNDGKSSEGDQRRRQKNGSIAFIGSYGSSSLFPIAQQLKENSISIPPFLNQFGDAEAVADLIKKENVDSIFTTGDNNYSYGCQSDIDHNVGRLYKDYIGNYSEIYGIGASANEFFPTLGNHDLLVHEAYLIKNDSPTIILGRFTKDEITTHRFSKDDWKSQFKQIVETPSTFAEELFQHLLDTNKFELKDVFVENSGSSGTTVPGISYLPTERITLADLTEAHSATLRNSITERLGVTLTDPIIDKVLHKLVFNLYCSLDENIGPALPYSNYFSLPGNE